MIEFFKQYLNNAIVMDACATSDVDTVTLPAIDGIDWGTTDPKKIWKNVEAVLQHRTPEEEAAYIEAEHCAYFNVKMHGLYSQGFFKTERGERLKVLATLIHKTLTEPEVKLILPDNYHKPSGKSKIIVTSEPLSSLSQEDKDVRKAPVITIARR